MAQDPSEAPQQDLPRIVPLIAASALFLENMGATVLATALTEIARDFQVDPIDLKLALTSYLISLAVFIPASGWVADRFGTRTVFCWAMGVFAVGSIACAFSGQIWELVASRVVQGAGGAMMIPVARLVVVRSVSKEKLIAAMAILTMPGLLGPIVGPPLGGFCATYLTWHWIFWINVPVAMLGILAARARLPQIHGDGSDAFDLRGFLLSGPGLALTLIGATTIGVEHTDHRLAAACLAAGVVLLIAYVRHALRHPAPVIDLRLLSIRNFRIGMIGGFLFRVGGGAVPFLLPLYIQLGLDRTAFESGAITFAVGIGAFAMKICANRILRWVGFRNVLVVNGLIAGMLVAIPVVFHAGMPGWVMIAILMLTGFTRSLQFTSSNAVLFADVPADKMSRATTLMAVAQEMTGSIGITIAAVALTIAASGMATGATGTAQFVPAFLTVAAIATSCAFVYMTLPRDVGAVLTGRRR
ncbi:MAG: MFS transporter [Alphaproteobacteria bacterium]|nr:MFS transporter [Alphaproteobacteria bacterium]